MGDDTGSDPSRRVNRGISPDEAEEIGRILEKVAKRVPGPGSDGTGIADSDKSSRSRAAIIAAGLLIVVLVVIFAMCIGGSAA